MNYILKNVHLWKDNTNKMIDLEVKEGKITNMRMNLYLKNRFVGDYSSFLMVPTFSTVIDSFSADISIEEKRECFKSLIYDGMTSFIYPIPFIENMDVAIKKAKLALLNSPIDSFFAIKISIEDLNENVIRQCKKYHFCAIFVTIETLESIENKAWGWIVQAYFNYYAPLVPIFTSKDKNIQKMWYKKMKDYRITNLPSINFYEPLSITELCRFGIFPYYANVHQGIELAYHLIKKSTNLSGSIHPDEIVYTFYKEKSIRIYDNISYYPGLGENIELKVQSLLIK